jgi:carboxypeptidase Q
MRVRRSLASLLVVCTSGLVALGAQERPDQGVLWKIRQEATTQSRILDTVHVLTDLYGPRLTGSPELVAAGHWAVQRMEAWGLRNGRMEPWDFGRPGWTNERLSAHLVSPVRDPLVAEALAWTPGTNGAVRGTALRVTPPQRPLEADLTTWLEGLRDHVRGRMILVGEPRQVPVTFNAPALRREDADVISQLGAAPAEGPAAPQGGRGGGGGPRGPQPLTAAQVDERLDRFLVEHGALVRINDAGRDHGQIRAFNNRTYDPATAPPTVVMRNEDYGRIARLLGSGRDVELEFDIVNRMHEEGRTQYTAIAEIPGTDLAHEVVMLGGHLDAWHAGTGATDNAIGCAVMMEVARVLVAVGVQPRRTIRVALWSGEEQGLLGSQAYVREHFGTVEDPKPGFESFGGYFNLDNGTGRARGMTVFGPPAAGDVLREALAPFRDLGVLGATTTRSRARASSDHSSFNAAGLPGIQILQDPIQYQTHTWHTNLDTYERVIEGDAIASAIAIAGAVYHLAMRDERLPRFTAGEMPRGPAPPPAPAEHTD